MEAIGNFFANLFSGLIDWLLSFLNAIFGSIAEFFSSFFSSIGLEPEIPSNVFDVLNELTIGLGYIFPVRELMPIFAYWITFYVLRVVFAVYHLIASTVFKRTKLKFK